MYDYDLLTQGMSKDEKEAFDKAVMEEFLRICRRTERQRQHIASFINSNTFVAKDDIGYRQSMIAKADFIFEQARGHSWEDDEFVKWWHKQEENAYARVKSKGTKIQTGYGGLAVTDRPSARRERIVYGKRS